MRHLPSRTRCDGRRREGPSPCLRSSYRVRGIGERGQGRALARHPPECEVRMTSSCRSAQSSTPPNWLEGLKARVTDIADYLRSAVPTLRRLSAPNAVGNIDGGREPGLPAREGDRVSLRFQVWRSGTEKAHAAILNQILTTLGQAWVVAKTSPFSVQTEPSPTKAPLPVRGVHSADWSTSMKASVASPGTHRGRP